MNETDPMIAIQAARRIQALARVDNIKPTMVDIAATADRMILKRFENILPKVAELAEKLGTIKQ